MLAKLAGDAQLASVGIVDPFAEHRFRPLVEHLEDFGRYLAGKDNVPAHVQKTVAQCRAVLAGCRFELHADLQPSAVVEFLAGLRKGSAPPDLPRGKDLFTVGEAAALCGISPGSLRRLARRGLLAGEGTGKDQEYRREDLARLLADRGRGVGIETSNHYLTAIKSFTRWLVKDRRAGTDPLAYLSALNPDVDVRHERRPLDSEDFGRFVEATAKAPAFRGLAGADRVALYCVAARTGLRASELGSLETTSFDLDADPATVRVLAAYSKHRRENLLPLHPELASLLRPYLAGKPGRAPVWPGTWTAVGAEMLRQDLARAGIPYRDDEGRVLDFHGLRHTFLTQLAESGVHPKVAQMLARHSTITLTMDRYTHLNVLDLAGDLEKLPSLPKPQTVAPPEEERRPA
jgi:integrase